MADRNTLVFSALLAADAVVADVPVITLQKGGHLGIHVTIDNGAGSAPADSPVGVWELWLSVDGTNFYQYTTAAIVTELALVATNLNNLVSAWSVFANIPGAFAKVRYKRTSGGGTSARAVVHLAA
jgi:hypothetical protein